MPFSHIHSGETPILDGDDALLRFILENEPNLVFIKDEDLRIVWANNAFLAIYPPDERESLIGTTTVENFTPEEAELFVSEDRRAFREGRTEITEEITTWTGRQMTLLTRKMAVQLASGEKRLVCVSTNITQLAARERRLVRLNAQLKVYSHAVAHDLRNPIASILSAINLIERDRDTTLGQRARMIFTAMRDSATGLAASISAMLKAAADEKDELSFAPYDLNLLIEEARFNLSAAIESAGLDLHVARLPVATVEPNLLRQLFQNLIENSIKYVDKPRPVVTIHYSRIGDEHVFYIGDNGPGIPDDKKDMVFQQFVQGSSAAGGLGLGLTICQQIATLHDGVLEIHDKVESGCCMLLRLPAR